MSTLPKGVAILDVETTISNDGNPFDITNSLCYVGIKDHEGSHLYRIEYGNEPYGPALLEIADRLRNVNLVVGFNVKFDIHWIRRYIPSWNPLRVWDCQLFEFIRSNQNNPYPSLDETCARYGIAGKVGDIAEKYWDNDINTTEIPEDELRVYLRQDLDITHAVYEQQQPQFTGARRMLFLLHCRDLLMLQKMEENGLKIDIQKCREDSIILQQEINNIEGELRALNPDVHFNWGSSDHLSAFLYGGSVKYRGTEIVSRTLKSGVVKKYERYCDAYIDYPRRVDPAKFGIPETLPTKGMSDEVLIRENVRRATEGKARLSRVYSTSEDNLRSIVTSDRTTKQVIGHLLSLADKRKLQSTYYQGLPKLYESMHWTDNLLHGTINQCRAITGRTSSSRPNLQNMDGRLKELIYSRYAN
jgi:DNA polymerase I-like protein with 3'-5' exonuclease and polymerase domains